MNTDRAADKTERRYGYAIVRLDLFHLKDGMPDAERIKRVVTVRNLVPDKATAEREVDRLNRLRAGDDSYYYCMGTRIDGPASDYREAL